MANKETFTKHVMHCKSNPNAVKCKGHKASPEARAKISASLKKAHAEGRAHNIGESRWNNEPSYPEKWFMRVVENELKDKSYVKEFSFHRFSIDFAWPAKKVAIEIGGAQHYLQNEFGLKQHARDVEKDKLLKEEGWKELRTAWTEIYANPKDWILKVKSIVDGD